MRFHIITFGCQMNVNDSDWISRSLRARGWEEADEEHAEVFIINTCSVREKPELKVYSMIGRVKQYIDGNPDKFIAVGGCVAQQIGEGFWQRFREVRLVFGTDGVPMVPQTLERLYRTPGLRTSLLDFTDYFPAREQEWPDEKLGGQAFVTIMQGCDNFCAYCIVPYVRGRQKSRPVQAILDECRSLVKRGVVEITLLGQNVNSYGLDKHGDGTTFAELLYKVAAIEGLKRLRFTTSHPKDIAPEVIRAFAELDVLCPYLHLPLQSGSDAILESMGRKYDTARYLDIVRQLKEARPDISLSTDFIVGFPGETDEDFAATLEMMDKVGYESSFSFKYSDRPGVRAEKMDNKVPDEVSGERLIILQKKQDELTEASFASLVGTEVEVLFERPAKKQKTEDTTWTGHDQHNRVVNVTVPGNKDLTGTLASVMIIEAKKHSLIGKLAE